MFAAGASALKVTIHLNDDTSIAEGFLHEHILKYLHQNGVDGATVLRPYAGFGAHRKIHVQGGGPVVGEHLPILIVFIEKPQKVRQLLPDLLAMVTDGLVEAHPVEILKHISTPAKVIR